MSINKTGLHIGIVVIGRNEGQRLIDCFNSIPTSVRKNVIYVDSGSSDDSLNNAKKFGIAYVCLDLNIPFTAGRARNEGYKALCAMNPQIKYVQFIDGDCALVPGWLDHAYKYLESHEKIAVVCGRRRERYPNVSIYNQLCDIEWDTPTGITDSCGGDFMIRAHIFESVSGFNELLIAGEEPDLCYRIRKTGKLIARLDHDMTLHDANICTFRQWAKRSIRAGYAYTEAFFIHYKESKPYWRKNTLSIVFWTGLLPAIGLLTTLLHPLFLSALLIYPVQIIRVNIKNKYPAMHFYGIYMMISKFTELIGMTKYLLNKLSESSPRIIEYK